MEQVAVPLGDTFENHIPTGKKDSKGREIGFVVGMRDNGTDFYAWVQNARIVGRDFIEFGVQQRSKHFTSQAEATRWAYYTVGQRTARIKTI